MCKDSALENGDMPAWRREAIGKMWQDVLEDVEGSNAYTKSLMWSNTYLLKDVVREKRRKRSHSRCTDVCEHCKLCPVEDFLRWTGADHGEMKKKTKHKHERMVVTLGGMPYDWRKPNRLVTLQIGDTANDQTIFPAYSVLGRNVIT